MITRHHIKGDAPSTATYSLCEKYRYALTRVWDPALPRLLFVMLNPSKATEKDNDPTVERCERRARALGFGAVRISNIFAWRDTDPAQMRRATDPVGPMNDSSICEAAHWADQIIAAWGTHGTHLGRGDAVKTLLHQMDLQLFHLGLSKQGHPRHPLYVPYAEKPVLWTD